MKMVSIITPTFNHEAYISDCIESVLAQTYPDWEMIIVDDGSTDRNLEVISCFKDDRIRVFPREHVGLEHLDDTYNFALGQAKGELVAILEGDDYWPPNKLERQLEAFCDGNVVLSFGRVALVTADRKVTSNFPENIDRFTSMDRNAFLRELLLMDWIPAVTAMCTRKALLEIGGFREFASAGFVDYPTWLALMNVGEVKAIDELLGYWRHHPRQVTASELPRIIEASADVVLNHFIALPNDVKQKTGLTYRFLRKRRRILTGDIYYHQAKVDWQEGRRSLARKRFARSLILGDFGVKKMSFIGYCLTCLGADQEFFVKHFYRSSGNDLLEGEKSKR
jgi:glycosyltransferase involved in cell wall biosynthesis